MKLFKYCKQAHAKRMVKNGQVRIGTLHEYRNDDRYNEQIADAQEGRAVQFLQAERRTEIDLLAGTDAASAFARGVISGWDSLPEGSSVKLVLEPASGLEHRFDFPDQYMYCATERADFGSMKSLGYDTCVEISDAEAFFSLITWHLPSFTGRYCAKPVTYAERRVCFVDRHADHPAFIKPASYEHQREFRMMWEPATRPISPFVVSVPGLGRYCRIVAEH